MIKVDSSVSFMHCDTRDLRSLIPIQIFPNKHTLMSIDHIHNNRHVGFDIVMQISHVVCQGANIKMMLFLRKSAGLNSKVSAPKSHLRAKM